MSEAPKMIWAVFEPHESGDGHPRTFASSTPTKGTPYILETHHTAEVARLEAEVARLREALDTLRGRYRIYAGWPEMSWAGETDKAVLAMADTALSGEARGEFPGLAGLTERGELEDATGGRRMQKVLTSCPSLDHNRFESKDRQ